MYQLRTLPGDAAVLAESLEVCEVGVDGRVVGRLVLLLLQGGEDVPRVLGASAAVDTLAEHAASRDLREERVGHQDVVDLVLLVA